MSFLEFLRIQSLCYPCRRKSSTCISIYKRKSILGRKYNFSKLHAILWSKLKCFSSLIVSIPPFLRLLNISWTSCKVLYQLFIKANFLVTIPISQLLFSFHKIDVSVPKVPSKGTLYDLRLFLGTESPLKMIFNCLYLILKVIFLLNIFKILPWLLRSRGKTKLLSHKFTNKQLQYTYCTISYDHFNNILRLLIFYQIFLPPQGKRSAIISNKHGIYKLPQELSNDITLRILGK